LLYRLISSLLRTEKGEGRKCGGKKKGGGRSRIGFLIKKKRTETLSSRIKIKRCVPVLSLRRKEGKGKKKRKKRKGKKKEGTEGKPACLTPFLSSSVMSLSIRPKAKKGGRKASPKEKKGKGRQIDLPMSSFLQVSEPF